MAFSSKLAELFVEFAVTGVDRAIKAFNDVRGSAELLSTSISSKLTTSADMLQRALAEKLAGSIDFTSNRMLIMTGRLLGWSQEQTKAAGAVLNLDSKFAQLQRTWENGAQSLATWGRAFSTTMGAASASMLALAGAGLHASVYGTMLQFRLQQLNLTIAGLFRPEIESLINGISRLTDWFRSLSDAQQESIARWTLGAAAASGLALILPRIASGIAAAVAGLRTLTATLLIGKLASGEMLVSLTGLALIVGTLAVITDNAALKWTAATLAFVSIISVVPSIVGAFVSIGKAISAVIAKLILMQAFSGPKGWLMIASGAALAAGAITALKLGIDELGEKTKGAGGKGSRGQLAPSLGGFEGVDAIYNRIAQASVQVGKPVAEKQLDVQERSDLRLSRIEAILASKKSAFA